MNNIAVYKLKELVIKQLKGLWGVEPRDGEDGIKVIKTNNMTYDGAIDYSDICERMIDEKDAEKNFLQSGDLLVEKSGGTKTHSVGYVNYFDGPEKTYLCNNFILAFRPNKELVNPKYLFYQLKHLYETGGLSDCYNKTTGIQNLKVSMYFDKEILVPSIEEQNVIVDVLDAIFDSINNCSAQMSIYSEMVKSRFIEMFGDPEDNPNNYEIKTISDLFDVGSSKRVFESEWTDSGVPFYRAREIIKLSKDGYVDNELFITEEMYEEYKAKYGVPKAGDMMVTGVGTLGVCYIVKESDKFYFKDGNTLWFKSKGTCNVRFIKQQFEMDYVLNQIEKQANVSTVGTYTITNANETKVIVPPIQLQNEYVSFVETIDEMMANVKNRITNLNELLNKQMNDYFENFKEN